MIDDAQTHRLPADRNGLHHVAVFLGYDQVETFVGDLHDTLVSVERHYADLFEDAPTLSGPGNLVFTGADDDPATLATLAKLGFDNPSAVAANVRDWHHGRMRATRSERAREILTELIPELLRIFGATAAPDAALARFDRFLSHLPAGVQLFSLFKQNPGLLTLVADIMAEAPRFADELARRPALLDAVLTTEFSAPLPDRAGLAADLAGMMAGGARFRGDALTSCAAGRTNGGSRSASNCCAATSTASRPGRCSPISRKPCWRHRWCCRRSPTILRASMGGSPAAGSR